MKKVIFSSEAPKAIGPYSQAILVDNTLYASGQLGIDPKTGELKDDILSQTEQSIKNIKAILSEVGMDLSNVIKTTCYLSDMDNFAQMNKVYQEHFNKDYPARSAIAVKTLPKNGLIEIEVIAVKN